MNHVDWTAERLAHAVTGMLQAELEHGASFEPTLYTLNAGHKSLTLKAHPLSGLPPGTNVRTWVSEQWHGTCVGVAAVDDLPPEANALDPAGTLLLKVITPSESHYVEYPVDPKGLPSRNLYEPSMTATLPPED